LYFVPVFFGIWVFNRTATTVKVVEGVFVRFSCAAS
jgi:hypothetical protein